MTDRQKALSQLIERLTITQGCDNQNSLRDILTDLRHVAKHYDLNFYDAIVDSNFAFNEDE